MSTVGITGMLPEGLSVLGMSGKARSGKNFLTKHIIRPMGFSPWALATPLKIEAIVKYGAPVDEVLGGKDKSPEVRALLQRLGTEEGRDKYGEDIWLKHAELFMSMQVESGQERFVITDVRFPNEVEWVQSLGGKVYRINGRGGLEGANAEHPSETALDTYTDFDATFDNSPGKEKYILAQLRVRVYGDFDPR